MNSRRRVLLLILTMIAVAVVSIAVSIAMLYRTALEAEADRLMETAYNQARMIEATVRRTDEAGVLKDLHEAHAGYSGRSGTMEIRIARLHEGRMDFLLTRRGKEMIEAPSIPLDSPLAEPMRRALVLGSGTCIAPDYRGHAVLAAHERVAGLGWGVVAKVDMAEIRAPFLWSGACALAVVLVATALGVLVVVRITEPLLREQRARMDALHTSESMLNEMGHMASIGGWSLDLESQALTWTREVYRIHELEEGTPLRLDAAIGFYAPASQPIITRAVELAIAERAPFDLELEMITAKGRHIWVHALGKAVVADGRAIAITGSFQDITERRRAADEISRLNAELEQRVSERTATLAAANQELESFSYSVSHDLRAPLRHIHGFIGILREHCGDALDATARQHLATIAGSAQRMGRLIDDLLSFSRMGRSSMRCESCDCNRLVREVIAESAHDCAGREVAWEVGELPVITADRTMLRQVFANLLGNALKYTRQRDRAVITIRAVTTGVETTLMVGDNGAGFDMRYADKLFGVFQRLHSEREFEGNGIGLAHVQRIVHRHGGRIRGEGAVGLGATFHVTLPLHQEPPA